MYFKMQWINVMAKLNWLMQCLPDFLIWLILTVVAPIDFLTVRAPFDILRYLVSHSNFGLSFGYCSQTSESLKDKFTFLHRWIKVQDKTFSSDKNGYRNRLVSLSLSRLLPLRTSMILCIFKEAKWNCILLFTLLLFSLSELPATISH